MLKRLFMTRLVNDSRGQALLFSLIILCIALAAGLTVSTRTVTVNHETTSIDTYSRVVAAAEGGLEYMMLQPLTVLDSLADGDNAFGAECPQGDKWTAYGSGACLLAFPNLSLSPIKSEAIVSVSPYAYNAQDAAEGYLSFVIKPGATKEITLQDYKTHEYYRGNINLCWKSQDENQSSAMYYILYNDSGIREKKVITPFVVEGTYSVVGDDSADSGRSGYTDCYAIAIDEDTIGLRVKTLYAPSAVGLFTDEQNLPVQGYLIKSIGHLKDSADNVTETKHVRVYKSLPYVPSLFDYAIYSNDVLD